MEESLFLKLEIEILDSAFQEAESDFRVVKEIIAGKADESEVMAALQGFSLKGGHDQVARGLLIGFLMGNPWLKFLLLTSRDGFKTICGTLAIVLPRLKGVNRAMELFTALMKSDSPAYLDMFLHVMRTIPVIKHIRNESDWVSSQGILCMVFYKLLRQAALEGENEKFEYVNLLVAMWKKRKDFIVTIGRDLVRLISALSKTPGIEDIWNDLYSETQEGFPAYWPILLTPTNPKFNSMLLPPLLESKLAFVIEHSPPQSFPRYLKWVLDNYPQCMLPDIVRFIVTYLPSREMTPRWQLIGWLLSSVSDYQYQAHIKQALIFDTLFFSPSDQIHTIEPVLSLIKFSLLKHPHIAEELLEFILTSADIYDKRSSNSIMKSLKEVMSVGYVHGFFPPLDSLCRNEKIDLVLRSRLSEINEMGAYDFGLSPVEKLEDTYINTKRSILDTLGEVILRYAADPSFESLNQILLRYYVIGEDLYNFLMRCMVHEYSVPLSLELNSSHIIFRIFIEAENNQKISELLKYMISTESSIGVRFLIFCLQTNSALYFKYSDKLERDLKSAMEDLSFQSLNWIFRKIFLTLSTEISTNVLHFYFQIATVEQIHQMELDISNGLYTVIGEKLTAILDKSAEFTATEQIYLWKIISAEVHPNQLDVILEAFSRSLNSQWEALTGLFHFVLSHISYIKSDHVKALLLFPVRSFRNAVMIILTNVASDILEDAICYVLSKAQFQGQINLLKHLKLWVETEGKLAEIVKTKNLQNILSSTLHSLSSDYFKEFSRLLETKQVFQR